ncbi:MAG: hypothetical protein KF878_28970 [Planctomycetes bacterium]|nr:hypothetical protein [Planctomycetota bacterium]
MLIDRTHRGWIWATALLTLIACAAYVPYHLHGPLSGPRGSTWQGLVYGGVATVIILFAGAIGLRRKVRARGLGRAEAWLKGHIWLGLLAYVLVYLHAGFRLGGALTIVLMVLFTAVVVSGVYGLIVQLVVPRLMTAQLPHETLHEQAPLYASRLREEAARAVTEVCGALRPEPEPAAAGAGAAPAGRRAGRVVEALEGSEPLKEFFLQELDGYLESGRGRLATAGARRAVFGHVRALSGPGVHPTLEVLEGLCEERRRLAEQVRLHGWLHGWLLVHLPLAAALILLTVVHAVASLYY